MLEHLFGSKTRLRLLKTFYREPERSFFVRELARMVDVQINAVRRELESLLTLSIIKEQEPKNKEFKDEVGGTLRKYYMLNPDSMIYGELQALLIKEKLIGEQEFVRALQEKVGEVQLLLLTGRFTGDMRASTDVLIVGDDVKARAVNQLIDGYEKEFGFEIRYTMMSVQEFRDRRYVMDKFLYSVFEADSVKVVNKLGV